MRANAKEMKMKAEERLGPASLVGKATPKLDALGVHFPIFIFHMEIPVMTRLARLPPPITNPIKTYATDKCDAECRAAAAGLIHRLGGQRSLTVIGHNAVNRLD